MRRVDWDDEMTERGRQTAAGLFQSQAEQKLRRQEIVVVEAPPVLEYDPALLDIENERGRGRSLEYNEAQRVKLDRVRDELFISSGNVCKDLMAYADIDPKELENEGEPELPEHWKDELGDDPVKLSRRMRLAKYGLMNKKDAPNGNALAAQIFVGMVKSVASEKVGPQTLNVQVVQMTVPAPVFETIDLPENT